MFPFPFPSSFVCICFLFCIGCSSHHYILVRVWYPFYLTTLYSFCWFFIQASLCAHLSMWSEALRWISGQLTRREQTKLPVQTLDNIQMIGHLAHDCGNKLPYQTEPDLIHGAAHEPYLPVIFIIQCRASVLAAAFWCSTVQHGTNQQTNTEASVAF